MDTTHTIPQAIRTLATLLTAALFIGLLTLLAIRTTTHHTATPTITTTIHTTATTTTRTQWTRINNKNGKTLRNKRPSTHKNHKTRPTPRLTIRPRDKHTKPIGTVIHRN